MNPGEPYPGPPAGPAPYSWPVHGSPVYAPPPYWGLPPRPRRPGQVTGAAVLSFVQAALVLCATLYVWLIVSMGKLAAVAVHGPSNGGPLVTEGTVLAILQMLSVGALLTAGGLALSRRSRLAWGLVLAAAAVQVALAGYWAVRLPVLLDDLPPGAVVSAFSVFTVFFAAGPLVTLGLVLSTPGRRWFDGTPRR